VHVKLFGSAVGRSTETANGLNKRQEKWGGDTHEVHSKLFGPLPSTPSVLVKQQNKFSNEEWSTGANEAKPPQKA
jgi:hypothetical protein